MSVDTKVMTNFADGSIISMDPVSMKSFLENIAMTTIVQCKTLELGYTNGRQEGTLNLPLYDEFIEKYCDGNHLAVLLGMLNQNVWILYRFVQDCVLNGSVKGLYLLNSKTGIGKEDTWRLILIALDEYMELLKREEDVFARKTSGYTPKFNEYNKQFEELMLRG